MLFVHTTPETFHNATITGKLRKANHITTLSHRFRKAPFSIFFFFRSGGVFKFLWFVQRLVNNNKTLVRFQSFP